MKCPAAELKKRKHCFLSDGIQEIIRLSMVNACKEKAFTSISNI